MATEEVPASALRQHVLHGLYQLQDVRRQLGKAALTTVARSRPWGWTPGDRLAEIEDVLRDVHAFLLADDKVKVALTTELELIRDLYQSAVKHELCAHCKGTICEELGKMG